MAESVGADRKRKRFSKNKKKYWKKHSDVKDVEEHLEDQRLQERTGGLVADKTDQQLFFLDKKAEPEAEAPVSKKRKASKPLKCHALLQPDPIIKPIKVNKNKKSLQKKTTTKKVTALEEQRLKERQRSKGEKRIKRKQLLKTSADHDLWGEPDEVQITPSSIADETKGPNEHYLIITKRTRKKTPVNYYKKPSGVPAIEVPHPGASYNPVYEDHQELLRNALEVEEQKVKEDLKLQHALEDKFPSGKEAPTPATYQQEMSAGLFNESDSESEPEFTAEELERVSYNPPVRREGKKTERQRKKEKQRKDDLIKALKEKQVRIKKNDIFRLKTIKAGVRETLKDREERATQKTNLQEATKDNPKRLGSLKFEENELEIKLSDEIAGSLRLLKPEGHLLVERYKSLQKRNIVEPRTRAKKVLKFKRKLVNTRSHKNYLLYEEKNTGV